VAKVGDRERSLLLAVAGCRGGGSASGATSEGGTSSSGPELDASGTTDDAQPQACVPGQSRACYEGPPGTEGVGACTVGQQACAADGQGWGACAGQVWPEPAERCDTPQDDDCDGLSLCEPTLEWWHRFPAYVVDAEASEAGGVVVVGVDGYDQFQGVELGGMFVAELDASGQLLWVHSTGAFEYAWPSALAVDPAGMVVVGGNYDGSPDLGGGPLPWSFGAGAFAVCYASGGEYVWGQAFELDGVLEAAIGPDASTYLVGGREVLEDWDRSPSGATIHVTALDPGGEVAWVLPGDGSWNDQGELSLVVTEAGELVLLAVAGGSDLALGGVPIPTRGYEPLLVRIGLDGTPLGHRPLVEPTPLAAYDTEAFTRSRGLVVLTTMTREQEGSYETAVAMVTLDAALDPVSQTFLGDDTWLQGAAPYPDGTTVVGMEFSGLLELGPIGVGGMGGSVVAVVDDAGQARWVEVLHSDQAAQLRSVSTTSDGGVIVVGWVDGVAVLAGVVVEGPFVAKLRP
jgi:hypothetical protein